MFICNTANWCLKVRVTNHLSLRTSPLKWCGNPPVRGRMYRIVPERVKVAAILGGNRYLVPFNRGIATTSVRTGLAMTALFSNTNSSFCLSRRDSLTVHCQLNIYAFSAASTTCFISTLVVTAPTPPGTGVMASTMGSTSSNTQSPDIPPLPLAVIFSGFQFMETSMTT